MVALEEGLKRHTSQTEADVGYLIGLADDVNVISLLPGQCLRDYEII